MKLLTEGTKLEIEGTDSISGENSVDVSVWAISAVLLDPGILSLLIHLQGIWNDNVACRIGWTCDMHLDINTQMNYWPAEFSGMGFVTEPLYRWIEERLIPEGRKTARLSYGMQGWVGEIVSNAWYMQRLTGRLRLRLVRQAEYGS